ncbi:MAG: DUF6789 family protein [Chloroflexota bacterium]
MNHPGRGALAGAIGGLTATLLMSIVMLGARRLGVTDQLPPDRMAERAIESATDRTSTRGEERIVASFLHLAFGTVAGAVFGALTASLRRAPGKVAAGMGVIYATGIWVISYQGWVPAMRILPPASRDDRGRVATMLLAHWVYGTVLGLATSRLRNVAT